MAPGRTAGWSRGVRPGAAGRYGRVIRGVRPAWSGVSRPGPATPAPGVPRGPPAPDSGGVRAEATGPGPRPEVRTEGTACATRRATRAGGTAGACRRAARAAGPAARAVRRPVRAVYPAVRTVRPVRRAGDAGWWYAGRATVAPRPRPLRCITPALGRTGPPVPRLSLAPDRRHTAIGTPGSGRSGPPRDRPGGGVPPGRSPGAGGPVGRDSGTSGTFRTPARDPAPHVTGCGSAPPARRTVRAAPRPLVRRSLRARPRPRHTRRCAPGPRAAPRPRRADHHPLNPTARQTDGSVPLLPGGGLKPPLPRGPDTSGQGRTTDETNTVAYRTGSVFSKSLLAILCKAPGTQPASGRGFLEGDRSCVFVMYSPLRGW